MPMKAYMQ